MWFALPATPSPEPIAGGVTIAAWCAAAGEAPYPLVVLFDGHGYHRADYIPADTIIDNLIAAKKLPPPVVVFDSSVERYE